VNRRVRPCRIALITDEAELSIMAGNAGTYYLRVARPWVDIDGCFVASGEDGMPADGKTYDGANRHAAMPCASQPWPYRRIFRPPCNLSMPESRYVG